MFVFLGLALLVSAQPYQCDQSKPNFLNCASYSMQDKIDAVSSGLSKLVSEIVRRKIDPRYCVVLIGDESEMVVDWTDSDQFVIGQFGRIRSGTSVSNFQIYKGGQEASFEAIGMALGKKTNNQFYKANVVKTQPSATGYINWRKGAQKFILLLTDEDSDRPILPENRIFGENSDEAPSLSSFSYSSAWGTELNLTAQYVIQSDAVLYAFTDNSYAAPKQYGVASCDKSQSNFLNFDANATYACLKSLKYDASLQGQVLKAGKTMRNFDINKINEPLFIQNFFVAAVDSVSRCERKRDIENVENVDQTTMPCEKYTCSTTLGCQATYTCADGCNDQCKINGACYTSGQPNPANACQYCNPLTSRTAWHTCGTSPLVGVDNQCKSETCTAGKCVKSTPCLPQCGCCCIGGTKGKVENGTCNAMRVVAGFVNAAAKCSTCNPFEDFYNWFTDTDCVAKLTPPSCTDKIQNQGEDGVDCGGPCPKCPDLCMNGKQDSGELGVDCGGVCPNACTISCSNMMKDGTETDVDCGGPSCPACKTPEPLCNGVKCLNGGVCDIIKNACSCAFTGYTGTACETKANDCNPKCLNGGLCFSGNVCDCTSTGFTGAACDTPAATVAIQPGNGPFICAVESKTRCALECEFGVDECICDNMGLPILKSCKTATQTSIVADATTTDPSDPNSTTAMAAISSAMASGLSPAILGAIIGGSIGGLLLCILLGCLIWRRLPDAVESMRYSSRRDGGGGSSPIQLKETDVL